MGNLSSLLPHTLWENFEALCNIPRPSKHEGRVIEYVKEFAAKHNIECLSDEVGNIVLRKPATAGMGKRKPVVLQAHLDMVPQKNSDTTHDFKKDPIQAYIDGDWVTAKGTTLGADNGIGVAAAMAILQSDTIPHPPIEALLTIDEETGMTGAFGLQADFLQGDILLNLDSEDEGELYIGCAGGIESTATFEYKEEELTGDFTGFKISVKGLKGGHSGMDIKLGRGNSNKIMNRIFLQLAQECDMRLATLRGGSLRNAIPRESFADVAIPTENVAKAQELLASIGKTVASELAAVEPDFEVTAEPCDLAATYVDATTAERFYKAVYAAPNGVIRMTDSMPDLPETSLNLAVITVKNGAIKVKSLLRSSVDSAKADLAKTVAAAFELAGASVETSGDYPGWKPNPNSDILEVMKKVYKHKWGKTPEVKAIHAGLECGLLGGVYPHWDMISFGPTIRYPHSPDEKVHVESVAKFWDYLVETLKNIPAK